MAATIRLCRNCKRIYRSLPVMQSSRNICLSRKLAYGENVTNTSHQTHFGFQTVLENEKEDKVYEVFHNVAEKYDLMNDVMSGGIHRLWKDYFMEQISPIHGTQLIDVAGGTGDIAFRFLNYVKKTEFHPVSSQFDFEIPKDIQTEALYVDGSKDENMSSDSSSSSDEEEYNLGSQRHKNYQEKQAHVTVCDINQAMLNVGKKKAEELGFCSGVSWLKGNAECLPVEDNSYDAYTIAFGIRNTTHIDKVLLEAYRVLKSGGRFMCLEFSEVQNPVLRSLYDNYSFQVIPVMGQVIAGDWKSYQYLVESIRKFPNQEDFAVMIKNAGFQVVQYENLFNGVAAIHSGFKL